MDEESKLEEKLSKWRKSRVISFGARRKCLTTSVFYFYHTLIFL